MQETELEQLAAALGVSLVKLKEWSAGWDPRAASTGLRDLLVKVPGLDDLRALRPDMLALARFSQSVEVVGLHAFCAADGAEAHGVDCEVIDYHVRNFAPLYGKDEEPATGTANCALACALRASGALPAGFVRRDTACRIYGVGATLVFAQGDAMGAPSRILVQLPPLSEPDGRPWVGGRFGLSGGSVAPLLDAAGGAALVRRRHTAALEQLLGSCSPSGKLSAAPIREANLPPAVPLAAEPVSPITVALPPKAEAEPLTVEAAPQSGTARPPRSRRTQSPPRGLPRDVPEAHRSGRKLGRSTPFWDRSETPVARSDTPPPPPPQPLPQPQPQPQPQPRTPEADVGAENRTAPGLLALPRLRNVARLLDPLDIALFVGVLALLYRYATARAAGRAGYFNAEADMGVGFIDASLLE